MLPTQQMTIPPIIGALYGEVLPQWIKSRKKEYFALGNSFLPLPAGTALVRNVSVQDDADFLCVCAVAVVTQDDNTTFLANRPLTVEISDSGSGRNLQNVLQHFDNIFGTAQLPAYWPLPALFKRGSSMATTVTSLDLVNDLNIYFAYLGFKIFNAPADINRA